MFAGRIYWTGPNQDYIGWWDSATGQITYRVWTDPAWPQTNGFYANLGGLLQLSNGRILARTDADPPDYKMSFTFDQDVTLGSAVPWTQWYPSSGGGWTGAQHGSGVNAADGSAWLAWAYYDQATYDSVSSTPLVWSRFTVDGTFIEAIGGPEGGAYHYLGSPWRGNSIIANGYLYRSQADDSEFHRTSLATGKTDLIVTVTGTDDGVEYGYLGWHPTYEHLFVVVDANPNAPYTSSILAFRDADMPWRSISYGDANYPLRTYPPTYTWNIDQPLAPAQTVQSVLQLTSQTAVLGGDKVYFGYRVYQYPTTTYGDEASGIVSLDLGTGTFEKVLSIPYAYLRVDGTPADVNDGQSGDYGPIGDDAPTAFVFAPRLLDPNLTGDLKDTARQFKNQGLA